MNYPNRIIGSLFLALFLAFGSYAQEPQESDPSATATAVETTATEPAKDEEDEEESDSYWEVEFGFVVGVGKASMDSLNKSRHGYLINEPWFAGGYYNGNFFVETDPANGKPITVGYTGYETDNLQVNFIATPFFLGFDEDAQQRGDTLTGIDNRNTSMDAGIEILSNQKFGQIGFRALHDASNTHTGFGMATAYSYPVYLDKMVVWPSVTLTYTSAEANDFYFGIKPHEVRPDRPLYQAGSAFITKLAFYLEYELTERTNLIGFSHYTLTSSAIHQSPLVSRNTSFAAGMGMVWIF